MEHIISNISDVGYISWNNTSKFDLSFNLTYSLLRVGSREDNTMNSTLTLCIMKMNGYYVLCK